MIDLYDNTGRRITLGEKIGAGGEGAVYEVNGLRGDLLAAKIYHEMLTLEKQAKLLDMVSGHDESLRNIAAWPSASLHLNAGGPVRGFLMPKLTGYQPIHHLYGPSHRKQRYPDKDWAFLVNTARNVAAAFEVIHGHGHVIGDVNPNLVFVAENSIVKLIDCDSFQIVANGKHHLCEVGVPYFTPPELQSVASFRDVRRTQNHDNFGLALLLFHILLMGRHPYADVFSGKGDLPLEKAIQQFCYAYGRHAASKKIAPPPMSVTPAILPEPLVQLFEQAFAQQGYQLENRPTAREWVKTLDPLKRELSTCTQESAHKYFSALPACPWCLQEQQSGNSFFMPRGPAVAVAPGISAIPKNQDQPGVGIQSPPAVASGLSWIVRVFGWFVVSSIAISLFPFKENAGMWVIVLCCFPFILLYQPIKWKIEIGIPLLFVFAWIIFDDSAQSLMPLFISALPPVTSSVPAQIAGFHPDPNQGKPNLTKAAKISGLSNSVLTLDNNNKAGKAASQDKPVQVEVSPKPSSAIDEKKSAPNSSQLIPKLNHGAELRNSQGKPVKVESLFKRSRVIGNKKYRPDGNSLRRALNPYPDIYGSQYTSPQAQTLSSGSRKIGNVEVDVNLMIPLSPRRIQHSTGDVIK